MLGQIFFFRSLVTPKLITLLYWVLILFVVIGGGIATLSISIANFGFLGVITGLLAFLVLWLGVRVYCELLIVLFRIHDHLKALRDRQV